jgi:hypothetical protein
MRIIKRTPTQLILQNRDATSYSFFALIVLLGGLGVLFIELSSPIRYSLICNRTESNKINCNVTKSYLNGSSINEEIKDLKGATIKEYRSGKNTNYEVVLQTNVSEVFLLKNADGGREKLTASVNDFVALPQQSTLQLQATAWGNLTHSVCAGLMAIAACSVAILVVSIKTYTFDKNLNQVVLKEKSLINKQELTFPLNQISAFRVEKADKLYEIILVFKTGACWHLVTGHARKRPVNKIVGKIENFLSNQEA